MNVNPKQSILRNISNPIRMINRRFAFSDVRLRFFISNIVILSVVQTNSKIENTKSKNLFPDIDKTKIKSIGLKEPNHNFLLKLTVNFVFPIKKINIIHKVINKSPCKKSIFMF